MIDFKFVTFGIYLSISNLLISYAIFTFPTHNPVKLFIAEPRTKNKCIKIWRIYAGRLIRKGVLILR